MDIIGNRILVTGGTGVLGGLIASQLREAGARTVVVGRPGDRLNEALGHSEGFGVDLAVPGAGSALIEAILAAGPLDGIVLAHGVVAFGNITETAPSTVAELTAINQSSVIDIVTAAIPALRESKANGHEPFIATISGVISESAMAGAALYGATKAAVRHFVSAGQRELRREGIRLFDTRPPHTETGLASRAIAGTAPNFPAGADPEAVAARIVSAILTDETDVPSTSF
jgi:cyclic-di-GMP-binding biofilm dispersal mediator protein